jgi:ferredoxin-NADP reductase
MRRERLEDPSALICASGQMMRDIKEILINLGVPAREIQTEEFDMV